jgi:selenocysteine-specific elongation factor
MRRLDEIVMPLARRNRTLGLGEAELLSQTLTQKIQVKNVLNRLVRERCLVLLSADPIEVMDVNAFEQLAEEVCQTLSRHHEREPLSLGISKEQLFSQIFKRSHPDAAGLVIESLLKAKKIQVEQEKVRLYGHQVKLNQMEGSSKDTIERVFREAGWNVPQLDEVLSGLPVPGDQARNLVAMLSREKKLVKISESLVFHSDAIHQLKEILANYKKTSDRIDVGKFKELIDVSRKYAIPLLEYLDRERITRRAGDVRFLL